MRAWNIHTCNFFQLIHLHNLHSQLSSNVAINNTICTLTEFNQLISCNFHQKSVQLFNITWHSSIYIWFNCWATFFLTIHNLNIFSTADSGITNTNYFSSHFSWCWLFHSAHRICKSWHQTNMSVHNAINKTTTTLISLKLHHASNINNKLFLSLVLITWVMQFFSHMIDWMTACWQP